MRVSLVKLIGSILTISSGGSAGREGPMALTCAGIGSSLASLFKANTRERRMFMLAGTAAGLGAIFRVPLGGAISAIEILYKEDFESSAMVPCVVSSVTGYTVFRLLLGLLPCQDATGSMYTVPVLELLGVRDFAFVLGLGAVVRAGRQTVFKPLPVLPRAAFSAPGPANLAQAGGGRLVRGHPGAGVVGGVGNRAGAGAGRRWTR